MTKGAGEQTHNRESQNFLLAIQVVPGKVTCRADILLMLNNCTVGDVRGAPSKNYFLFRFLAQRLCGVTTETCDVCLRQRTGVWLQKHTWTGVTFHTRPLRMNGCVVTGHRAVLSPLKLTFLPESDAHAIVSLKDNNSLLLICQPFPAAPKEICSLG